MRARLLDRFRRRPSAAGMASHPAEPFRPPEPCVPFPRLPWWSGEELRSGRFRFVGLEKTFHHGIDWNSPDMSLLWRYNLHYFQYLFSEEGLDPGTAQTLIMDWMRSNPPGSQPAWDPFPMSLRIVNWLKFLSDTSVPDNVLQVILRSLFEQARFLEKRLERHLLANHLFKNLKALLFAGASFQGKEAARWLRLGARLLHRELDEQILPDGGHFERSPMYHCMILEDCLDLLNIAGGLPISWKEVLEPRLREACRRMAGFLSGIVHPDGDIPLLNDAAFAIELPPVALLKYALGLGIARNSARGDAYRSFPNSGYYVFAPDAATRLIADCGPIGPNYQPGHAHCDTLSYELSVRGRRLVVDGGVYTYEEGPMRRYNRSTAAHNTVRVDGKDQSEIWKSHRVGRRARPLNASLERLPDGGVQFSGAHDGYRFLPERVIHRRRITWQEPGAWSIVDRLDGSGRHSAESFVHLHPEMRARHAGGRFEIIRENGELVARIHPLGRPGFTLEKGWYCPHFHVKMPNDVIVFSLSGTLPLEFGYRIET